MPANLLRNNSNLPHGDDFRLTLRLAVPLIVAEVGWMSMGVVDTIMVGRLPNSAIAIGATGLGQGLYHVIAIFGGGLLLGMDTFVAHAYGRESMHDARSTLLQGLLLAVMLAPILMVAVAFWPLLMLRFGISTELVGPMRPFLTALNWGTLPLLIYFALRRYLQAVNVAVPVTFAVVSANLVNAIGNWALIYGHLGFRALGITGSGWSTCMARIYMMMVLAITLVRVESSRTLLPSAPPPRLKVDAAKIWALLKLGAPAAGQILVEIGAFSAATVMCAKLGPLSLAGHEIALNCAAFTFMVPLGISSAAAVRVGQELGRHDPESARRAGWSAILLGVGFMGCAGLAFIALPRMIARVFTPDPAVLEMGATLLLVAAAFQLFDGIQVVTTGALRGAGDTKTAMLANVVAYWLIGVPLGHFLGFRVGWGAVGVWVGLCTGLVIIGSTLLGTWKIKKLGAANEMTYSNHIT